MKETSVVDRQYIPFLKPDLVTHKCYAHLLEEIDSSHVYSNYGPLNKRFEQRVISDHFGDEGSVVTVNNATIGLMLAIAEAKRLRGRYAVMPSFTFAATPMAALWCGLTPYFIDVDPERWCMDEGLLSDAVESLGDDVAVVVPYATFGCNLDLSIYERLHFSGVPVVVDAASSFGASANGRAFGRSFPGHVVFSFQATKSFGIGEGGLVYSGNHDSIERIRRAGNFGFNDTRESTSLGLNSKLSEYAAAIALATLDTFDNKLRGRRTAFAHYIALLEARGLLRAGGWQIQHNAGGTAPQFFPVLCPPGRRNTEYVAILEANGVQARTYFSPACHEQAFFRSFPAGPLPVTEDLSRRILSLPMRDSMPARDLARIVGALE